MVTFRVLGSWWHQNAQVQRTSSIVCRRKHGAMTAPRQYRVFYTRISYLNQLCLIVCHTAYAPFLSKWDTHNLKTCAHRHWNTLLRCTRSTRKRKQKRKDSMKACWRKVVYVGCCHHPSRARCQILQNVQIILRGINAEEIWQSQPALLDRHQEWSFF